VPSFLAGVGLALSLPPWGFWILAGPAAGLLWWRLGGLRWRQRLLAGWVAGLGLFLIGLWWVISFNVYGGIILIALQALVLALACAATPAGRGRIAALTGAMVLVEALRSGWPLGGLPLGGIALGQAAGPLADAARIGGPLLLVGLVWLGGAGLGALVSVVRVPGPKVAGQITAGVTALAVVAGLALWGSLAPDGGDGSGTLRVASVQGGGVRGLRKSEVNPASVFAAQRAATAEIGAVDGGRPPQLVVWPEDAVSLDAPLVQTSAEKTLAETSERLRATLTVGVTETVSSTSFRNEIVAFGPNGRLVARFEKVHRVPFGEYIPARAFFSHLANLSAVPLDAIPGHGNGVLRTPAGPIGTMVSYEVFFAARGRIATRAGAQLLIVPTNTSSYTNSQVPTQEIAASRIQALAEGRDLIQSSPTGFSAIIDHDGRVLARSDLGVRQVLIGNVRLRTGRTVYEDAGDLPVLIGAGILLIGGWVAAFTDADRSETASSEPSGRRRRAGAASSRARRST
jgi:apolipoprotein N-acyltransferase